ncbi:MAG: four helix bundle protein [Chloroflexi bacterium]|nr:four helix bundle protein [Ardenticatenaceae bacterium]MBL1128846.1 four helix bundle protein [Chloroflexota bacterium]NOG34923.1 four helix bundle protein [Chloroflexota bacterium]GIK58086.1 MAG: hypothetical protein BroJett015_37490 [Chloroflexota bacterium]
MATSLEDLKVLQSAERIADDVWKRVVGWEGFAKDTIGKQLVTAVDSVGANIAEAYGRFHYGEKTRFLYFARGSLFETKYWLNRSYARNLIEQKQLYAYALQLSEIGRQINAFAGSLKSQQKQDKHFGRIREPQAEYLFDEDEEISNLFTPDDLSWLESAQTDNGQSPISNLQSPQEATYD